MSKSNLLELHVLTDEQEQAAKDRLFDRLKQMTLERRQAAVVGRQAMDRLADVMRTDCGQAYHLRALLYSLYNGKATSVIEVLNLDWAIRQDFATVIEGFGYEDKAIKFHYDEMKAAISCRGRWDWFIRQGEVLP